jgi:hypothetical protein
MNNMSDDLGIEITEVRDNPEATLKQHSPNTETLVDMEKGVFVKLGIPETNGAIVVPDDPHIFIADELRVRDKRHQEEMLLENVVVLMGHGVRDSEDRWKFLGGQGVSDTLNGYNKYAKNEGLPEAEFLAVCNKDKVTDETGVAITEQDIGDTIAYAAGTEVNVQGVIEPDGKSRVYVQSKENMFNLDTLQTSKEIEIIE